MSFLSLDTDGRVIRLDSLSKVLSAGLRVGFATGPKEMIRHLELSIQHSVLHASSLSQVSFSVFFSNEQDVSYEVNGRLQWKKNLFPPSFSELVVRLQLGSNLCLSFFKLMH